MADAIRFKNTFRLKPAAGIVAVIFSGNGLMSEAFAAESIQALPEVEISADKDVAVDGYLTKKSSASTKTSTLLRDIPQSITVATPEMMQDMAVQNLGDIVRYTPGVGIAQGEGNRETFIFRGNSTTADFFVDGVRDDTQYYRDLYNIDRVEVLKGPNGMIFGRGGSGGLINRVSKEAGWDPVRELSFQFGSYDQRRTTIDFGQAINDVAAFRINAMYEDGNSYRDGVSLERKGINPTVTLKPGDKTKVTLSAEYFEDDRTADRGVPSRNGHQFSTSRSTFFGNARLSPTGTEVSAYSVSIEHAFDNGITLRNRARYADYDKFYQNVFASGAVNNAGMVALGAYSNATDRENTINQTDVLYGLDTGTVRHELLAGVELARQVTDNYRKSGISVGSNLVAANNPVFNGTVNFANNGGGDANNHSVATTTAFYLQDQIKFSPKFEAVLGLRYDEFDTDFKNKNLAAGAAGHKISVDDDFLSPRVGFIFKPVEPLSLYTSYSVSYVPRAGEQLASLTVANSAFRPEKFKSYEIGAKWDISPDLALTAAVYRLERTNVAISDPADPTTTILVDGQDSKGFELGVNGRITSAWSIVGGYAYQDAEITKRQANANPNNVILAGADIAQVPRHTLSLWNRYDFNEVWGAALGVISRSDMYAATPTVGTQVTLPGYTRFDAAVYAKLDESLKLQLNVENLFNKKYALYSHNANNITPGSPTAARATLIYNF